MSILLALAAATVVGVPADTAARDLRCLVASEVVVAGAPTATMQQQARIMMTYFLGRVEAEVPENKLADTLSATLRTTPKNVLESDQRRCAGELESAGHRLQALGAQLKTRGE